MIPLPRWVWPYLLDRRCPICSDSTNLENVSGIGIRQKEENGKKIPKGNAVLTFEYMCPTCDQATIWIADPDDQNLSAEDIVFNILETMEQYKGKRIASNRSKVSLSQISYKELQNFKKSLGKLDSHEDFLHFIGVPQDEIDRLKKDEKKNGDKNK